MELDRLEVLGDQKSVKEKIKKRVSIEGEKCLWLSPSGNFIKRMDMDGVTLLEDKLSDVHVID